MRSGWQQTPAQEEQRRRAPFGPEVSWPTGYQGLEYRDGAYSYQEAGADGGQARGEMPYGEHPYAVSGPVPGYEDFGYGDPGYSDPRYEGPDYQDAGDRGPDHGRIGNQWSGAYPTLPGAANDPRYDDPRLEPFGSGFPTDPGFGTAGFAADAYDQPPGYGRSPGYGQGAPGYGQGAPGYGQGAPGAVTGERTRFDMPVYDETAFDQTRYDMPVYDESRHDRPRHDGPRPDGSGYGGPSYGGPSYGDPSYGGPSYGGPSYAGPEYGASGYDEPAFGQSSYASHGQTAFDGSAFDGSAFDGVPFGEAQAFHGADDYDRPFADDATRYDMPALSAPVMESAGFDVDAYRDFGQPALDDFPPDGFGQSRGSVLPHTGMMLAVPDTQLAIGAVPEADAFDSRILEKTGAFEAAFDTESLSPTGSRVALSETMLDMQGAALLKEISESQDDTRAVPDTTGKRVGKRRGGSRDHRQWIAIGAIVVVAAGAAAGGMKFAFPSHGGPAHTMATPATVGAYTRKANLEAQMNVQSLVDSVSKMSNGQATNLVSAVYQAGSMTPGGQPQIFMFIGGHLNNADPGASISSFEAKYSGAKTVSAGSMGGQAACVEVTAGAQGNAAMCIWFDNDSFGELVSSTMNTGTLQNVMTSVRPSLELVSKA